MRRLCLHELGCALSCMLESAEGQRQQAENTEGQRQQAATQHSEQTCSADASVSQALQGFSRSTLSAAGSSELDQETDLLGRQHACLPQGEDWRRAAAAQTATQATGVCTCATTRRERSAALWVSASGVAGAIQSIAAPLWQSYACCSTLLLKPEQQAAGPAQHAGLHVMEHSQRAPSARERRPRPQDAHRVLQAS